MKPTGLRRTLAVGLLAGAAAGCAAGGARAPRDLSAEIGAARGSAAAGSARGWRDLARLLRDPGNPSPDYAGALAALRAAVVQDPGAADEPEVRSWLGPLEALERAEQERARLARRVSELERESRDLRAEREGQARQEAELREQLRAATRENEELRGRIERLKELDRSLERLRQNLP